MRRSITGIAIIAVAFIGSIAPPQQRATSSTKGGNVVPTQSPGPFVNNPTDPDNPTRGRSVGQLRQDGIDATALCRAAFSPR